MEDFKPRINLKPFSLSFSLLLCRVDLPHQLLFVTTCNLNTTLYYQELVQAWELVYSCKITSFCAACFARIMVSSISCTYSLQANNVLTSAATEVTGGSKPSRRTAQVYEFEGRKNDCKCHGLEEYRHIRRIDPKASQAGYMYMYTAVMTL